MLSSQVVAHHEDLLQQATGIETLEGTLLLVHTYNASISASIRKRNMFLFLTLALVLASFWFMHTFYCAYACACIVQYRQKGLTHFPCLCHGHQTM